MVVSKAPLLQVQSYAFSQMIENLCMNWRASALMRVEMLMKTLHQATSLFAVPLHEFPAGGHILNVISEQPHEALHHFPGHRNVVMMSKDFHPVSLAGREQ